MRFLKNKLIKARELALKQSQGSFSEYSFKETINYTLNFEGPQLQIHKIISSPEQKHQKRSSSSTKKATKEPKKVSKKGSKTSQLNSAKNIVKNYGRAICSFALSDIALFYLEPLMKNKNIKLEEFKSYVSTGKERIDGISSFRSLLLVTSEDSVKIQEFKKILRDMSIIFIKDFSTNWIFSSKLLDKMSHLKCRFKMLRRVMQPEHFTYLKTCS